MTHQIVPPYLLENIAATDLEQAAPAARQTLAITREHHLLVGRTQLQLSIENGDTLVAESEPAPDRTIADAGHAQNLPGRIVRREDDPAVADAAVNEAYDGLGTTFNFFWEAYGRNSIDGHALALDATVHYGRGYDNAFWNGERMVFGDGDGEVFRGFTGNLTVIAHELTHGVTETSGGLDYSGQPGALNESVSDVFGALTEQWSLGQTAQDASWLIGEGLFTAQVHGMALRSMKAPGTAYDDPALGKDPQPATMDGYVHTADDNGGVHINSGIPNHAFYLAAAAIGGHAWEAAGLVWYKTLTGGSLEPSADFRAFARATVATATAEFGADAPETTAVRSAWRQVGVLIDA